jgi:ubiquinone/menaquinone biosynthesis C-methylase UbiE
MRMPSTLPLPPGANTVVGKGDYETIGREFFGHFVKYGGLQPHHRVLDVGCGIGRMARPLTEYLNTSGRYEGFDVMADSVEWCQKNITPRYPNFRFRRARVANPIYNQWFGWSAWYEFYSGSDYVFPYRANSFDFIFLTSVFTHMRPAEVENYVREINRVLKVGGKCFATYFLQTPETRALGEARRGSLNFVHRSDGYWIDNPKEHHEAAICYDESHLLDLYRQCGLQLAGPVRRGSWSGVKKFVSYQDIVVAEKASSLPWQRTAALARTARAWRRFGGRAARALVRRAARVCGLRPPVPASSAGRRAA